MNTTDILKNNVKDLQGQLAEANKRINELTQHTSKLMTEREYNLKLIKDTSNAIKEIKVAIKTEEQELVNKIQKTIDDWPKVFDSKPKKGDYTLSQSDENWTKTGEWTKFENEK